MQIPYFEEVNPHLSCSGQPRAEQFKDIAMHGYQVVINLTIENSIGSLSNEKEIVEGLGMKYVHLPVRWENPQLYDVLKFFALMGSSQGKQVLAHCKLNTIASCFVYMYQTHVLKIADAEARVLMDKYCEPSNAWLDLLEQVAALHKQ